MSDEFEQIEEILEEPTVPKSARKGKATGIVQVELHYVQQNMLNFAKRNPDMAYSVESVFQDYHLDDEHLQAVLNRGLPPELNHFIRWLLKIPHKQRIEWQ